MFSLQIKNNKNEVVWVYTSLYKSSQIYTNSAGLLNEPKFLFKLDLFNKRTKLELSL